MNLRLGREDTSPVRQVSEGTGLLNSCSTEKPSVRSRPTAVCRWRLLSGSAINLRKNKSQSCETFRGNAALQTNRNMGREGSVHGYIIGMAMTTALLPYMPQLLQQSP